ncbi:MAG: terminase large subunit domain-containing protein [Terriglobales bacterium]
MAKKLGRLEALLRRRNDRNTVVLESLAEDPVRFLTDANMQADAWQAGVLRSDAQCMLLLASRQAGKSSVAAALALQTALLRPRSPVLLLSPSLRQSGELFRKIVDLFDALGRPMGVTAESALRLELSNGSRVVSLPGDEKNIRGFSGVALLVIDEAARVNDALYYSVRPMLAVSQGRLVALSTPFGKRGWFHDEWHGDGDWERVKIAAEQCPRISPTFLAEERRALGERWYKQEYGCEFSKCIDSVFSWADIQAALRDDIEPLFPE